MAFSIRYRITQPKVSAARASTAREALNLVRVLEMSDAEFKSIRSPAGNELTIGDLESLAAGERTAEALEALKERPAELGAAASCGAD